MYGSDLLQTRFIVHVVSSKFFLGVFTREDPPSRLAKMGALPTPFRGLDRAAEDTSSLKAEREEPRSETPPGKPVPLSFKP